MPKRRFKRLLGIFYFTKKIKFIEMQSEIIYAIK